MALLNVAGGHDAPALGANFMATRKSVALSPLTSPKPNSTRTEDNAVATVWAAGKLKEPSALASAVRISSMVWLRCPASAPGR